MKCLSHFEPFILQTVEACLLHSGSSPS